MAVDFEAVCHYLTCQTVPTKQGLHAVCYFYLHSTKYTKSSTVYLSQCSNDSFKLIQKNSLHTTIRQINFEDDNFNINYTKSKLE